ncbi:hypothetical protein SAMN05192559_1017 [Halobacillus karajensis]|uniref:Uncharacterized protein n=1 Tax=Halobacillus karajensis TaxID=195088 RepID=A0A024P4H2_9BACI|nr:hypothetical protein BN982_01629 [Halobacillus karajensis]CDQ22497.1 hypothetical protein BN983_00708 [Halobacillus karajensis]CDQ25979.1 hypothetical protein BN981_00188 [Halobacillus karajensis]SEH38133.1 hypothetical protein SAMN05192559_1017 [Halobacillus karajensis]
MFNTSKVIMLIGVFASIISLFLYHNFQRDIFHNFFYIGVGIVIAGLIHNLVTYIKSKGHKK